MSKLGSLQPCVYLTQYWKGRDHILLDQNSACRINHDLSEPTESIQCPWRESHIYKIDTVQSIYMMYVNACAMYVILLLAVCFSIVLFCVILFWRIQATEQKNIRHRNKFVYKKFQGFCRCLNFHIYYAITSSHSHQSNRHMVACINCIERMIKDDMKQILLSIWLHYNTDWPKTVKPS